MNKKKFILLILLISLIYIPVKADSGFDSSYYYGSYGSYDSYGLYDYNSSYDGSSLHFSSLANGSYTTIGAFITLVIIGLIIIFFSSNNRKRIVKDQLIKDNYKDISSRRFKKIDNISIKEFKEKIFNNYKEVEEAIGEYDKDIIDKYTIGELNTLYINKIDNLKNKKYKKIIKNMTLIDMKVINIVRDTIYVYIKFNCLDYMMDKNDKIVVGSDSKKIDYEYILTIVKKKENYYISKKGYLSEKRVK